MRITNEKGRSMIEMLGVLAIVGVLTVGSLSMVGKARQQYNISQILGEATTLISNARKMACDYEEDYGSYTNMLYRSEAYPDGMTVTTNDGAATEFVLTADATLAITGTNNQFTVVIGDLPESVCVAIMTADWNSGNLIGASANGTASTEKTVELDTAASACSGTNPKLTLTYSGCIRADHDSTTGD